MAIEDHIGAQLPEFAFEVDRSQLRLFAKAIGETRPEYLDVDAARAAGYRDLPALPTFPFSIAMNPAHPFDMLDVIGADLKQVLHGEQCFDYVEPICAGDRIHVRRSVTNAYEKRGGAFLFYVIEAWLTDAAGDRRFCSATQTIIVRTEAAA